MWLALEIDGELGTLVFITGCKDFYIENIYGTGCGDEWFLVLRRGVVELLRKDKVGRKSSGDQRGAVVGNSAIRRAEKKEIQYILLPRSPS